MSFQGVRLYFFEQFARKMFRHSEVRSAEESSILPIWQGRKWVDSNYSKSDFLCTFLLIFCTILATFFQDIWSEGLHVIARAKARSNPAFANFTRSEIGWGEMSEMSDFGNKKSVYLHFSSQYLHSKVGLTKVNQNLSVDWSLPYWLKANNGGVLGTVYNSLHLKRYSIVLNGVLASSDFFLVDIWNKGRKFLQN